MRLCVVGAGYVGLVTGACLSKIGHDVCCVDVRAEAVDAINAGRSPIVEPGLDEMLKACVAEGRFRATRSLSEGMAGARVVLIAVGTPTRKDDIDLSFVRGAASEIGRCLTAGSDYRTVTVKSTVVPGTTDTLVRRALEEGSGLRTGAFGLCMNPEFLREGCAIGDFMEPDRIVIGQWDERSGDAMAEVYAPFACPVFRTSLRNAEMIKYTANALLATLISFSNQIAMICERVDGVDVDDVMAGVHLDRRFSPVVHGERVQPGLLAYLKAGAGYGGSCFPKDMIALTRFAKGMRVNASLLDAVMDINRSRPIRLVDMTEGFLGTLDGRAVSVFGLTFKPHTDDLRESPALAAVEEFIRRGAVVKAYDPEVPPGRSDPRIPDRVVLCENPAEAAHGAEALVLATAWPEIVNLDWVAMCAGMAQPLVVDGRNALKGVAWAPGTRYVPVGRMAVEES